MKNMHYKIEGTIRRNKGRFIIFAVLWLMMAIGLVAPLGYAQHNATIDGVFDFGEFVTQMINAYTNFNSVLRKFYNLHKCIYVCRFRKNSSKK